MGVRVSPRAPFFHLFPIPRIFFFSFLYFRFDSGKTVSADWQSRRWTAIFIYSVQKWRMKNETDFISANALSATPGKGAKNSFFVTDMHSEFSVHAARFLSRPPERVQKIVLTED